MTTPAVTIALSNVNTELARAAAATINMDNAGVRTLAGVPSGTIAMSNLRSKSNAPSNVIALSGAVVTAGYWSGGGGSIWNSGTFTFTSAVPASYGGYPIRQVYLTLNPNTTFNYLYVLMGNSPPAGLITKLMLSDGTNTVNWVTPTGTGTDSNLNRLWYFITKAPGDPQYAAANYIFFNGTPTSGTMTIN